MPQTTKRRKKPAAPKLKELPEVLTIAEAAAHLRVQESDVLDLIRHQDLPGRQIAGNWRFLKSALEDWLRVPAREHFWQRHFGALKDDPYLDEMLEQIYEKRGRSMVEES